MNPSFLAYCAAMETICGRKTCQAIFHTSRFHRLVSLPWQAPCVSLLREVLLFYRTAFLHILDPLIEQGLQILVQAEASFEILLSRDRFALPLPGQATVRVGADVAWIESKRLVEFGNGFA